MATHSGGSVINGAAPSILYVSDIFTLLYISLFCSISLLGWQPPSEGGNWSLIRGSIVAGIGETPAGGAGLGAGGGEGKPRFWKVVL